MASSPEKEDDQDVQHLFRALTRGKTHLTRFMLAASASLLNCLSDDGRTPLIECCYIREEVTRATMVGIIKDAGADVNFQDLTGRTALIHACEQRCNDLVKLFIQHADIRPDVEDHDGNTALIHSAIIGNDVALELLVRNFRRLGLQIDHFNKEGYTAIHIAAKNGFLQCARVLAVKGRASLTIKDKVNQLTPLEICLQEGYQKTEVEFLKPSAKFYTVAKLTTTMAWVRKMSGGGDGVRSIASRLSMKKKSSKEKNKSNGDGPDVSSDACTSESAADGPTTSNERHKIKHSSSEEHSVETSDNYGRAEAKSSIQSCENAIGDVQKVLSGDKENSVNVPFCDQLSNHCAFDNRSQADVQNLHKSIPSAPSCNMPGPADIARTILHLPDVTVTDTQTEDENNGCERDSKQEQLCPNGPTNVGDNSAQRTPQDVQSESICQVVESSEGCIKGDKLSQLREQQQQQQAYSRFIPANDDTLSSAIQQLPSKA